MHYTVRITEKLSRLVDIVANSPKQAENIAWMKYEDGDIVLDSSDYDGNTIIEVEE